MTAPTSSSTARRRAQASVWPSLRETKAMVVQAYARENLLLADYLVGLPADAWDGPSLCAGWSVRDVVAHLAGQGEDFLDRSRTKALSKAARQGADVVVPLLVGTNRRHQEEGRRFTPSELIGRMQDNRGRVAVRILQIPTLLWLMKIRGMVPMRMYEAMGLQVFEGWVHRQDIQRAQGEGDGDGPFGVLLPVVFMGVTRMRNYEPLVPLDVDFGEHGRFGIAPGRGFVPGPLADAVATVHLSAADFVLVAAGRLDADDVDVAIEGREGPARELLYSLRFQGLQPGL